MKIYNSIVSLIAVALALPVLAEDELSEADPGIEIVRDATAVNDLLTRPADDRDFVDTALVLTDQGGRPSVAYCAAFDHRGNAIGRVFTAIPGNGLSVLLASDMAMGQDFVGKIKCRTRGNVVGTAFIVGPGLTDTRVGNGHDRLGSRIVVQAAVSR